MAVRLNPLSQQEQAEGSKQKSEQLLYQILPREIANRLNEAEKDISFTVTVGRLMFIDIQKFSAHASTLSPQEIMSNLSLIFSSFDGLLPTYPLTTKITLIGDVYMCAAGLFALDEAPRNPTDQMARFAAEAIQALDQINVKLATNLSVRVGVNTGGPIVAGVLGTDEPVFDIIRDAITVAARLQSSCLPKCIQVSQERHDVLKDMDYVIEIFLKGKYRTDQPS
jgi:class 3 adenylate cyclase